MSFFSQLQQNVTVSAGNTTLTGTTLNAKGSPGDTFTGSSQSTLGVAGLQINLKCDQNCIIYVDQAMDAIPNWDIVDSFNYYASLGGFSFTVQATAAYMRVRVQNQNTTTATSTFRLQTALCPIVEAVPRALSAEGNLKVGVYEIEGDFGSRVEVTPFNAMKVAQSVRLVGTQITDSFDTNFWVLTTATGTASATVSGRTMTLATNPSGVGSGNSVIVNSQRTARYIPGISNYYRGIILCPAITGANTRRWGCFNAQDGYYFEYDGTTLKLNTRKGGADGTPVSSGSFNGKLGSTYTLNTNLHTYEIHYNNRSTWFFIDDVLLHKISQTATVNTNTLHFQIGLQCTNGANTNNNTLIVWSSTIRGSGVLVNQPQSARISTTTTTNLKIGPGILHSIIFGELPTGNGTITVYDNTNGSGAIIWRSLLTRSPSVSSPIAIDFKSLPFNIGLTIVTNVAAPDLTVIYE